MTLWSHVAAAGPAGIVLVAATLSLLALPILRRLAPRSRRQRGGSARLFLVLALLLAASAVGLGTMGAASPGNILQLAGLLALMFGLVGLGGLFVFDVVLPRLGLDVPSILGDLVLLAIALAIGMGFLRLAGLDVLSLVTTSAVLTAVIGLALQSTIANVFGGLSLQLDRTLRRGEWIEVGEHVGRILEIGWRSTCIQTKDGDTVFVPNGELISKDVRTFSRPAGAHRMTVRIGFHYRHPPSEVRRVLLAAICDTPGVADRPAPECGPVEFGDSAVVYALRYWITDFAHDSAIHEGVHTRVWYASRRADLEMPSPIRTFVSEHGAAKARAAADELEREGALHLLETVEPFSRLDPAGRQQCARGARRLEFAPGEHVLRTDEPDDDWYVIDSGDVVLHVGSNGSMREAATLGAGDVVGRQVLADGHRCMTRTEAVVFRFDARAVDEVVAAHPQIGASLSDVAVMRRARFATADGVTPDRRAAERRVRFGRLFKRRERNDGSFPSIQEPRQPKEDR